MSIYPDLDTGVNIFLRGFPAQITENVLESRLRPYLMAQGISAGSYNLHKTKNRGTATLHVQDRARGERFLAYMRSLNTNLQLGRFPVLFDRDGIQDGGMAIKDKKFVAEIEADLERNAYARWDPETEMRALSLNQNPPQQNQTHLESKRFEVTALNCGNWSYSLEGRPVYIPEFSMPQQGRLLVGHRSIVVLLYSPSKQEIDWEYRLDFPWEFISNIYFQRGPSSSILLECNYCPRMYQQQYPTFPITRGRINLEIRNKMRVPSLNTQHSKFAGSCLTYECALSQPQALQLLQNMLESIPDLPPTRKTSVQSLRSAVPFDQALRELNILLSHSKLDFAVRWQAYRLATNGKMHPRSVVALISTLESKIVKGRKDLMYRRLSYALKQLYRDLPYPGPHASFENLQADYVQNLLEELIAGPIERRHLDPANVNGNSMALIHHLRVTPAGMYLEGPEWEVTNRVLRRYAHALDCFIRVTFSDEDGERLQFKFNVRDDAIYDRFRSTLENPIPICGKAFHFLGFSQSSLRSQTAWFMAPFQDKEGRSVDAPLIIQQIGDFSHFRSPAKCAARIGQAFTDTDGFITLPIHAKVSIVDIERNGRVFSDGCGLISPDIAEQIADKYHRLNIIPNVFQIRYQGAKGVLSASRDLPKDTICIRPSMLKFDAKDTHDLEICGIADKPRPLFLNRGLIKVLEDLGVPHNGFLELAKETLERLQGATSSVHKAVRLMEHERVGTAAGLPGLITRMDRIGINMYKDRYLCAAVEVGAFCRLRAMKYKGRIFIKDGIKLIGIMDETGYLKEGQIHCVWIDEKGRRKIARGKVAVTRSPTNHPGDVQLAIAVEAPRDSPLQDLCNCIVFSQHGDRDLPSQLGGGDLDGDLYDVFWDPRIMPPKVFMPANYPRLPPIDIGRTVTSSDIAHHFINFMKNDNIGLLANQLLVLSDRLERGTMEPACIIIEELMSKALDYPKTGIVADLKNVPRFRKDIKPDFMAPGPKVKILELEDPSLLIDNVFSTTNLDDPVAALDSEERKTTYYKSKNILGKLYRMVDEKGFYEELQGQTRQHHHGQSAMKEVFNYARRAVVGFDYTHHLPLARELRSIYGSNVEDTTHEYALHSAHPLNEIEVVTGAVLGSVFVRKLHNLTSDMRDKYARDVAYIRDMIRGGEDDDGEALARSVACLYIAVHEKGRRVGRDKDGHRWSFQYVVAAHCLELIERYHGGRLQVL